MAAAYWASEYSLIRVAETEGWDGAGASDGADRPLEVIVLHVAEPSTRRALKAAAELASGMPARVRLVAPRVVPFPLELNAPQVPIGFTARQLREIAGTARVDTSIDIILCRDLLATLSTVLKPRSLIVIGSSRSPWWRFAWLERENRLAQCLRKLGHQVIPANVC